MERARYDKAKVFRGLTEMMHESHTSLVLLFKCGVLLMLLYVALLLHERLGILETGGMSSGDGGGFASLAASAIAKPNDQEALLVPDRATSIPTIESDGLTAILAEGCQKKYGTPRYKNSTALDDMSDGGIPPLLLSFPGAGNTMLRALLEHATGIFTGSIYLSDKELLATFDGEKTCTRLNSVIKGHPSDFVIRGQMDLHNRISKNGDKRDKLRGTSKFMRRKCANGKIQHFSRAIFVTREPFKSIMADFQRISTNSHVGSVSLNQSLGVNLKNVKRNPLKAMNLTDVWLKVAMQKAKDYEDSMLNIIKPLFLSNYSAPPVGNKNPQYPDLDFSTHVVRFEDIVSRETRYHTLAGIVKFIFPAEEVNKERLMCAFYISDMANTHRKQTFLDIGELYNDIRPSLVCDIWNRTQHFGHAFGYYATPNPAYKSVLEQCNVTQVTRNH